MTLETDRRCNKELARIADVLEAMLPLLEKIANPPMVINIPPADPKPQTYPWPNGGYRCAGCGTWVMSGTIHTCTGRPWPGGGTGSPNICGTGGASSSTQKGPHYTVWNGGHAHSVSRQFAHGLNAGDCTHT